MEFVGRKEEIERLDDLCRRRHGGLAVLTGRRRVGKTRLLVEWNRRHGGLYTVADQSAAEIQRRYFCEALASRFPVFLEATFRDWRSILKVLAQQAEADKWKGPVILDEFPFLVTSSPELPSVLQHWIDREAVLVGFDLPVLHDHATFGLRTWLGCPTCRTKRKHLYFHQDQLACRKCLHIGYLAWTWPDSSWRKRVGRPMSKAFRRGLRGKLICSAS
jgi:hypothetical protein